MNVGDIVEAHKGERGIILDIELMYPNNKYSPPRSVHVHWFDKSPHWHKPGLYAHVSGIKRVISSADR